MGNTFQTHPRTLLPCIAGAFEILFWGKHPPILSDLRFYNKFLIWKLFVRGDHIMLNQPSNKHVCSLARGWLPQSVPKILSLPIVLQSVPDYNNHYHSWIHQQYHISFSRFSKRFLGGLLSQPDQLQLSPRRVEHGQGPTSLKNYLDLKS